MKKIIILFVALFVFAACENNKKAEEKKVEEAIQKIDSISTDIEKSADELDQTVKEAEEALGEIENI